MAGLRWMAIVGQIAAITVAQKLYNLQLELGLCYLVIGISIIGNLFAMFVLPENKRLTEREYLLTMLFDLLQLSVLLFLTGGLHNPFSLLLLAPVTVASSVLSLRSNLILGATAIASATLLMNFHLLLKTHQGFVLRVPDVFMFGTWVAIVIGVVFISIYSRRVSQEMNSMSEALQATQMALSREQQLTDLGGVVAAAAHELGTPLATIKLTSGELADELEDRPDLKEDAELIREQADRCRDILRSMGRAGKDDRHVRQAPLSTVVRDAAEPHIDRGVEIIFEEAPMKDENPRMPSILRRPEIIHGVRNLVQNAVDFANEKIWVEVSWSAEKISVRIIDDGRGFPSDMIGRIGDPFMRRRTTQREKISRPGYEGMGLGLFIAKTLLERSGAELTFYNGHDEFGRNRADGKRGAIVNVEWNRPDIDARNGPNALVSGSNQPIDY
jgi:two-component system, sensor histidine kinase RegB